MNEIGPGTTRPYLYVMPRHATDQRWHVFQINVQASQISLEESITSYVEVHKLAASEHKPLRIATEAWQQMRAAGVAPQTVPDGVAIV